MGEHFKNLKGFINKQVTDVKFRFAGSGQRLNEQSQERDVSQNSEPVPRIQPSSEAQRAGQAALTRLASSSTSQNPVKKPTRPNFRGIDVTAIKAELNSATKEDTFKRENQYKEALVHFQCPLIGPQVLSHDEWMEKIKDYLEELIATDKRNPSFIAVMIKSVNDPIKANFACEKLKACLKNIVDHPEEEKYKKIKANNPLFKDKLLPIYGCEQFLFLCGFKYVTVDDIKYLIFQPEDDNLDVLKSHIDALTVAEPITLVLDRNVKIFHDSIIRNEKVSDEFFKLTTEEVKLEAARRHEEIEEMKILKTRAMREKSNISHDSIKFAVIKIKFPDGFDLQGTFSVTETVNDIKKFVTEHLKSKSESFNLLTGVGRLVLSPEKTIAEENLIPSALIHFEWNKEIAQTLQSLQRGLLRTGKKSTRNNRVYLRKQNKEKKAKYWN